MVPSRNAVIVRMGWTFNDSDAFDSCQFVSDELKTLEQGRSGSRRADPHTLAA